MRYVLTLCLLLGGASSSLSASGRGAGVQEPSCAGCKAGLKAGAKFCTNCGKKVETPPRPGPEPPAGNPSGQKETSGIELEKFGVTAEAINRAIDRGAAFLAARYRDSDPDRDEDYLCAYALAGTRIYQTNGALREKLAKFLRGPTWRTSNQRSYAVAVRAMALEASGDPDLQAVTRECAEYLIEAQGPEGTWEYVADVDVEAVAAPAASRGRSVAVSGGLPLEGAPPAVELVRKGKAKDAKDGDNSSTQFAVLGLHAAARCGFKIPRDVWRKCLETIEKRALADGGWSYLDRDGSYGSMTCAGISTLVLCRHHLGETDPLAGEKLKKGLEWLAGNFEVSRNPKGDRWPFYYLYSVERVGIFCGTESIGPHRWYPLGAKHLVASQDAKDGSWTGNPESPAAATSFALLFLRRATAPVRPTLRGGKGVLETQALRDRRDYFFILDASGSMREEMGDRDKLQVAKDTLASVVPQLPPEAHVGLRVYGHRRTALEEDADRDSELIVPPGPLETEKFLARLAAVRCRGKTPLTYSIEESIKDLSLADRSREFAVILLTDGGESTRGAKPPGAAARLAGSRKGTRLYVVGFDIREDSTHDQLKETARAGRGEYVRAGKPEELLNALRLATGSGTDDYVLRDVEGREVLRGRVDDRHELPEGKYSFVLEGTEPRVIWINTGVTTRVSVRVGAP